MKILLVGGYGTFGGRIVELLEDEPRVTLVVAGRSLARAEAYCRSRAGAQAKLVPAMFDREGNLDRQIGELAPDLVVDASGPFQAYGGGRYRLIEACIGRGLNYMDLADGAAFVAGVDYFGVSDLKTLVESFPPYWASAASSIYKKFGDPKNPAHAQYQHDRSPVHFIDRIVRPLLVVQGERDPRVRKDQSDRIVAALESRKVPVHYLVIPNEGHGFSQVANNLLAASTMDRFLDRYVFGDTSAEVIAAPK